MTSTASRVVVVGAALCILAGLSLYLVASAGRQQRDAPHPVEAMGPIHGAPSDAPTASGRSHAPRPHSEPPPSDGFEPAVQGGMLVRVVEDSTGRPASDVAVHVWSYADHLGASEDVRRQEIRDILRDHGHRYRTDEQGAVRIPEPRMGAWIWAKKGDAEGLLHLAATPPRDDVLHLRVIPHATIRVRDRSGHPLSGVPVVVGTPDPSGIVVLWEGVSRADDGSVTVEDLDAAARARIGKPIRDLSGPLCVGSRIPFEPPAIMRLPDMRLPEQLDFVLPDAQSLVVRVLRGDRSLLREPVVVNVRPAPSNEATSPRQGHEGLTLETDSGEATFARVGTGTRLHVTVEDKAGSFEPASILADISAGSAARSVDVILDEDRPRIVAHLVDERGVPVSRTQIVIFTERGDPFESSIRTGLGTTDDSGRLVVPLRPPPTPAVEGLLRLSASVASGGKPVPALASIPVKGPLANGVTDAGTVSLVPTPVAVEGRVIDESGAPITMARLRIASPTPGYTGIPFEAVTDASGGFSLRSPPSSQPVEVAVAHEDFVPAASAKSFAFGSKDVVLVMNHIRCARGSVLLDDDIDRNSLVFLVSSPDGRPGRPARVKWEDSKRFSLRGLPATAFDLEVTLPGLDEPLRQIPNLRPDDPAAASEDGPLMGLDLRGLARRYLLRVVDSNGGPVRGFRAVIGPPEGDGKTRDVRGGPGGDALFYARESQLEVTVTAEGFATAKTTITPDNATVVLTARMYDILLTAKTVFDSDAAGAGLVMVPVLESVTDGTVYRPFADVAPGSLDTLKYRIFDGRTWAVAFRLPTRGRFAVRLELGRRERLDAAVVDTFAVNGVTPAEIEVRDSVEVQPFALEVSTVEIDDAIGRIR